MIINSIKTIWITMWRKIISLVYNKEKLNYQETKVRWDEKKKDYVIERKILQ